jgi:hypothetical protein
MGGWRALVLSRLAVIADHLCQQSRNPSMALPTVALIQPEIVQTWEVGEIERITELVKRASAHNRFVMSPAPDSAELVILLETCSYKTQHDIPWYRQLPYLQEPLKLCCINYEDGPPGFLPGLYSSLESYRFEPSLHISWPHLRLPNELAELPLHDAGTTEDEFLFVFAGACSHPFRQKLFDQVKSGKRASVRLVNKWYNHDDADKRRYVDDIRRSKFVLCPRGLASYSHRIVETLAMGRVPVVIADDWVPFSIEETGYYVQIREADVAKIESLLTAIEPVYESYRRAAGDVYRKYFAPEVRYSAAINRLCQLQSERLADLDLATLTRRWSTRAFYHSNGWCLEQRIARKAAQFSAQLRQRLVSGGSTP